MNSFRVLTKEETKEEMKKKDFDEFLTKNLTFGSFST